ncbi:MAG: IS4 family transposase, partial [Fimbriimonadales bacterium]
MNTRNQKRTQATTNGTPPIPQTQDDWTRLCNHLPLDLEATAYATQALQRKRHIQSAHDLLRLVLAYSLCDYSLRQLGAWAHLIGLGTLSDVALYRRLCRTKTWLGAIVGSYLHKHQPPRPERAVSVRLIDATVVRTPGSQRTHRRLHLQYDLATGRLVGLELTDQQGRETLTRHTVPPEALLVADRGYAHREALGALMATQTAFVVRTNGHNLPLVTADGKRFDWVGWLQACQDTLTETQVWLETPTGRWAVRWIAYRLPEPKASQARRRAYCASRRQGHTPNQATLVMAGFVVVVTNLPAGAWSAEQIADLYRLRWQIEVVFKRLKGVVGLEQVRAKASPLVEVYLLGKLVGGLLLEGWAAELAGRVGLDWFGCGVRPVSLWRWQGLWWEVLCSVVRGRWEVAVVLEALEDLERYLRDGLRGRVQQAALARVWLRELGELRS